MANFELLSFARADELARAAAGAWLDEIEAANRAGKRHCVALSGGRITQKFFTAVVEQNQSRKISFTNVHFFWADERCALPTHSDSNFKLADELLFQQLKIAAAQIHRLRGELPPAEAVTLANHEIRQAARQISPSPQRGEGWGEEANKSNPLTPALSPLGRGEGAESLPALDLVLLGMGEDGHIASLFPNAGSEILNCAAPFLTVANSPKPPTNRISLSYAVIAAARQVCVLVSGAGKEVALKESLKPDGTTPLARVIQMRTATKIFSDLPDESGRGN